MCFWNIWHKAFTMGGSKRTIHHLCNSIHLVSAPNVGRLKVGVMSRIWNLDIWCQQFLLKGLMSQHCWYFSLFLFGFHYPRHLNISFWLQQQKVFPIQFTWTTNHTWLNTQPASHLATKKGNLLKRSLEISQLSWCWTDHSILRPPPLLPLPLPFSCEDTGFKTIGNSRVGLFLLTGMKTRFRWKKKQTTTQRKSSVHGTGVMMNSQPKQFTLNTGSPLELPLLCIVWFPQKLVI